MNSKLAKKLRKRVREKAPFLSKEPLYRRSPQGGLVLVDVCQRYHYKQLKQKAKRGIKVV